MNPEHKSLHFKSLSSSLATKSKRFWTQWWKKWPPLSVSSFIFLHLFHIIFCGGGCWWDLVPKSCPPLANPWIIARQASLSMILSRKEYWNGLPLPFPGDLPNPGIETTSPVLQADFFFFFFFFYHWATREAPHIMFHKSL